MKTERLIAQVRSMLQHPKDSEESQRLLGLLVMLQKDYIHELEKKINNNILSNMQSTNLRSNLSSYNKKYFRIKTDP